MPNCWVPFSLPLAFFTEFFSVALFKCMSLLDQPQEKEKVAFKKRKEKLIAVFFGQLKTERLMRLTSLSNRHKGRHACIVHISE